MSDREFDQANAAIERAVATFISAIERLKYRYERVAAQYVIATMLRELCDELAKLIDDPNLADSVIGPAEMRLSNALADYRDTCTVDGGGPLSGERG